MSDTIWDRVSPCSRRRSCTASCTSSGGNGPDGIVAALCDSEDRRLCGVGVPGACAGRDHKCGEWAGEGTAGDREDQVFQIEAGAGEKKII